MKTLADLKVGEQAIIQLIDDEKLALKLSEMGCLPNTCIQLKFATFWQDPIGIQVICKGACAYCICLRKADARHVVVES